MSSSVGWIDVGWLNAWMDGMGWDGIWLDEVGSQGEEKRRLENRIKCLKIVARNGIHIY